MSRYGIVTRKIKISLRTVCKLGTIAHNKSFSPSEFQQYIGVPSTQLSVLMRRGVVKRVSAGRYYPTARGWDIIERACRARRR